MSNDVSLKHGGNPIEFEDEDPEIRSRYERECAGNGVKVRMPKR